MLQFNYYQVPNSNFLYCRPADAYTINTRVKGTGYYTKLVFRMQ